MPRKSGSSSSSSGRTYVDNSYNRSHGRVGMSVGSAVISSGSSGSSASARTYVDNSYNRTHGRVGMDVGSAVISSRSSNSSASSQRTYVDNSFNRSHDRVGLTHGTALVSSRSSGSSSASTPKTYVDNSFNRSHDRVGLPLGEAPVSSGSSRSSTKSSPAKRNYVDNALNKRLGRVGKPVGSMPNSKSQETTRLRDAFRNWEELREENEGNFYQQQHQQYQQPEYQSDPNLADMMQQMLDRMDIWKGVRDDKSKEYQVSKSSKNVAPNVNSGLSKDAFNSYAGAVIKYDQIELGVKIGHGGFGDIFSANWNGKSVAVKKLRVQRVSRKRLDQFIEEITVFHQLKHRNILEFYGACIKTPNLCIVMELMEASLFDKLHVSDHQFTMETKLFMVKEISCGLEYLHSMGVAHCDIKSSNVLLSIFSENEMQVKLTDFGLSLMKNDSETTTSAQTEKLVHGIGTPRYSSPEVLRGELLDRNAMKFADVYSFGLVVHEIVTEEEPFGDLNLHQLREHVGNRGKTLSLSFFQQETDRKMKILESILQSCWSAPKDRPSIRTICVLLE